MKGGGAPVWGKGGGHVPVGGEAKLVEAHRSKSRCLVIRTIHNIGFICFVGRGQGRFVDDVAVGVARSTHGGNGVPGLWV